jgi:hypothetical protein
LWQLKELRQAIWCLVAKELHQGTGGGGPRSQAGESKRESGEEWRMSQRESGEGAGTKFFDNLQRWRIFAGQTKKMLNKS